MNSLEYECMHMRTNVYIHIYRNECESMYVGVFVCMYVCMCGCIHTYVTVRNTPCIYVHIHVHIHVHILVHIHIAPQRTPTIKKPQARSCAALHKLQEHTIPAKFNSTPHHSSIFNCTRFNSTLSNCWICLLLLLQGG